MLKINVIGKFWVAALVAGCSFFGPSMEDACAEIIDDIRLKTDANGEVDAVIKFTVPVQRLRYFPPRKSQYLVIYFNILDSVPRDRWQNYESHRSPPSDLVGGFTITTRDLNTGPRINVQFLRPVEFSLKAGRDSQTLYLHIKPEQPEQRKEEKPAAVPVAPIPPSAVIPPTASPAPATPASPVVSKETAVMPPVATAQPSAPVQQLGGKDGLPRFPSVEQDLNVAAKAPASGELTLQDQIRKANADAAVLMAKGRDALFAGNAFAAIEAFNQALNLPPNKYTPDAQIWIGIARERTGQQTKAKLEYEAYMKLYPDGANAKWVRDRLAKLNALQMPPSPLAQAAAPVVVESKPFETNEYGSLSMYYYHGASHTDTIATVGAVQTPTSLTLTDQSSLISNVSFTMRSFNDVYDNRLVFQDFYSANFLAGQQNKNRLNAAYYEIRNRNKDYSARVGRQSALGGGVMGRFDGISGGVGILQDWRVNAVIGQLSETTVGPQPKFYGASMDFGVKSAVGGTLYYISQTTDGLPDRKAAGGNIRYFDQGKIAIANVDYDLRFRELNMLTIQGTVNGDSGTDYNFLLDRRMSPSLSIKNAVNGAFGTMMQGGNLVNFAPTISSLLDNGFTVDDLVALAKQRTAVTNLAQVGLTRHIREKWQLGADLVVSNTSGMPASGTQNPDGTTGLEGYVAAMPASGNNWTLTGRLIGNDVITVRDITIYSLSYTRSHIITGTTLLVNNHSFLRELWTLDTTLRFYWQSDNVGGREYVIAPTLKLGYQLKNNLALEAEGGLERTKSDTPSVLMSSTTTRKYYSLGFRWDF